MVAHGQTATILVVEDDPGLRKFYRNALMTAGYTVLAVEDGIDALRHIERAVPSLVVLDLALPRLSGHDVQKELKARAETRMVPIVVVSGDTRDLDLGDVACVLRKPLTAEQLIEAVEKCLRNRRGSN